MVDIDRSSMTSVIKLKELKSKALPTSTTASAKFPRLDLAARKAGLLQLASVPLWPLLAGCGLLLARHGSVPDAACWTWPGLAFAGRDKQQAAGQAMESVKGAARPAASLQK
jgi:hypothetical protein